MSERGSPFLKSLSASKWILALEMVGVGEIAEDVRMRRFSKPSTRMPMTIYVYGAGVLRYWDTKGPGVSYLDSCLAGCSATFGESWVDCQRARGKERETYMKDCFDFTLFSIPSTSRDGHSEARLLLCSYHTSKHDGGQIEVE